MVLEYLGFDNTRLDWRRRFAPKWIPDESQLSDMDAKMPQHLPDHANAPQLRSR